MKRIPPDRLSQDRDNQPLFVIAWVSLVRNGSGRGRMVLTKAQAIELAEELNLDYPDFYHWPEPIRL